MCTLFGFLRYCIVLYCIVLCGIMWCCIGVGIGIGIGGVLNRAREWGEIRGGEGKGKGEQKPNALE